MRYGSYISFRNALSDVNYQLDMVVLAPGTASAAAMERWHVKHEAPNVK